MVANMKAVNQYIEIDVVNADEYVKRIIPEAKYMSIQNGFTFTFISNPDGEFNINGELYHLISTNPYDWIIKHFGRKEKQITIFDYLGNCDFDSKN